MRRQDHAMLESFLRSHTNDRNANPLLMDMALEQMKLLLPLIALMLLL